MQQILVSRKDARGNNWALRVANSADARELWRKAGQATRGAKVAAGQLQGVR